MAQSQKSVTPYVFPVANWLLAAYVVVSPFFVFSVVFTRDTPSLWIIAAMGALFLSEFVRRGGNLWMDRSMVYLLGVVSVYCLSTCIVYMTDSSISWAGRTQIERAIGIDSRLLYSVLSFFLFVNLLAGMGEEAFARILRIQIVVGVMVALFGIVQYVLFVVYGSTALVGIESTNEAYRLRSNFLSLSGERVFRASSFYSEPSYFGFFLVPVLVKGVAAWRMKIYVWNRICHGIFLAILLWALLVNLAFTAIVAVMAMIVFAVLMAARKSIRGFFGLGLISVILILLVLLTPLGGLFLDRAVGVLEARDLSSIDRVIRAYSGIMVFMQHPILGVGPGCFSFYYPDMGFLIERQQMYSPLNMWISILTDVGIVGFVPFVLFLWSILTRARKKLPGLGKVYVWSIVSFLVLLTSVDFWMLDLFWFELALLLTISDSPGLSLNPEKF